MRAWSPQKSLDLSLYLMVAGKIALVALAFVHFG